MIPDRGLLWLSACDSTNDEAWDRVNDPAVQAVATDQQHRGRGRRGRSWHSPPGMGLYLSWIARPTLPPELGGWLPLMAAVAAARVCEHHGITPQLKWPNDLLLDGGKLAGILCEARAQGARWQAVVGIGLNLRTPEGGFPEGVPGTALDLPSEISPREIARQMVESLNAGLREMEARPSDLTALAQAWEARSLPHGTPLRRGEWVGTFEGLAPDGSLKLKRPDGTVEVIRTGEVELIQWGPTAP
ncbi:MAG: biotin--[acetyl-CoA-carboxylase] ligase [Bradymonadia bacterium]